MLTTYTTIKMQTKPKAPIIVAGILTILKE